MNEDRREMKRVEIMIASKKVQKVSLKKG